MRGPSGVLVFALVVLGFMAFGYSRKDRWRRHKRRRRSLKTAWRNPLRPPTSPRIIIRAGVFCRNA